MRCGCRAANGFEAWTVLTALAVDAAPTDGCVVVRASVRSLAVELGLNKDTIARAILRLRDAGLVVHRTGGSFEHGAYRRVAPADVVRFSVDAPAAPVPRHRHVPTVSAVQLRLLEVS
jgi:DNA-binding transcriptional MocR family regulator